MRLPDEVLKCVVFIGRKEDEEIKYRGTGFFVAVAETYESHSFHFFYLVTAKHIADKFRDCPFYARVNLRSGQAEDIPFNWEQEKETKWYFHPEDPDGSDVAVTPINFSPTADVLSIRGDMIVTEQKRIELGIGVGDEVFIVGLFSRLRGKAKSIPIVRVGNIAMYPDEKVRARIGGSIDRDVAGFLIEARSIGGLSGSPVVARQTVEIHHLAPIKGQQQIVGATGGNLYLVGFVCAHWDVEPRDINEAEPRGGGVNLGIAIVIPSLKIAEVIYGPELTNLRKEHMKIIVERRRRDTADEDSGHEAI